jgi:RNA polymerase sigma-70 factor (ECF subfamily)
MSERPDNSTADAELVALLQQDADAGVAAVSERYREPLVRFCASMLQDAAKAEDVVQDTLAKLRSPEGLPSGALRPWLYRLARNACLDILRRLQRSPTAQRPLKTGFDAATKSAGPGTKMARSERQALIRQIVEAMPEEYRDVLMLKFYEGLSRAEIAAVLEVSEQTVKGRLARASAYLEEELRKYTWTLP